MSVGLQVWQYLLMATGLCWVVALRHRIERCRGGPLIERAVAGSSATHVDAALQRCLSERTREVLSLKRNLERLSKPRFEPRPHVNQPLSMQPPHALKHVTHPLKLRSSCPSKPAHHSLDNWVTLNIECNLGHSKARKFFQLLLEVFEWH
jgi:hypothetical protein